MEFLTFERATIRDKNEFIPKKSVQTLSNGFDKLYPKKYFLR